jgi:multimeric flavodoxin WrbA
LPPPLPRKGTPYSKLTEDEFRRRFLAQYIDPAFDPLRSELDRICKAAWNGYTNSRKSPRTQKAGNGFSDPNYDLAIDWLNAHNAIQAAERTHNDKNGPTRVVLICASSRNEHTCPGEMSKSYRFSKLAEKELESASIQVDLLDLSRLTVEYGINIHPCKACFSTAAALCHWPCSCYPNYSLGQTQDMMNEIYPLLTSAHGRLVCADGGNPDPTTTHGKDAAKAKEIEMKGWDYPRHLEGRLYSLVVHGDAEGAEGVRHILSDWLNSMGLQSAGKLAELDRYIGYWKPYATNHEELDRDEAIQEEVKNAARTLAEALKLMRSGQLKSAGDHLSEPRQK